MSTKIGFKIGEEIRHPVMSNTNVGVGVGFSQGEIIGFGKTEDHDLGCEVIVQIGDSASIVNN